MYRYLLFYRFNYRAIGTVLPYSFLLELYDQNQSAKNFRYQDKGRDIFDYSLDQAHLYLTGF
jgi:hypothetical protein